MRLKVITGSNVINGLVKVIMGSNVIMGSVEGHHGVQGHRLSKVIMEIVYNYIELRCSVTSYATL